MIQVYLLNVEELRKQIEEIVSAGGDPEDTPGWDRLAPWQQEKAFGCTRPGARALCMGGQLLLQYGACEILACKKEEGIRGEEDVCWRQLPLAQVIEGIPGPLPLQVAYGPKGKPYICQVSWHYNLSHSGDLAALAISDAPVGIDVQQMRPYRDPLVKRFFAKEETAAYERLSSENILERESRTDLFYTLWCRKEAYGKLLGTGLTEDILRHDMLKDFPARLYEYAGSPGYRVCVCGGGGSRA